MGGFVGRDRSTEGGLDAFGAGEVSAEDREVQCSLRDGIGMDSCRGRGGVGGGGVEERLLALALAERDGDDRLSLRKCWRNPCLTFLSPVSALDNVKARFLPFDFPLDHEPAVGEGGGGGTGNVGVRGVDADATGGVASGNGYPSSECVRSRENIPGWSFVVGETGFARTGDSCGGDATARRLLRLPNLSRREAVSRYVDAVKSGSEDALDDDPGKKALRIRADARFRS